MPELAQSELLLQRRKESRPLEEHVEWFVDFLAARDWITAAEILGLTDQPVNENAKRRLRALADASGGRVAGHQRGYKLVRNMTREEYDWWRNEWLKSARAIERRVVESDKLFFHHQPAPK